MFDKALIACHGEIIDKRGTYKTAEGMGAFLIKRTPKWVA